VILLDVGVWLAASWGRHIQHRVAATWFDHQEEDLAMCRVTQMSLLRLLSNPAVMNEDVLSRGDAWRVIDQLRADARVIWAEEPVPLEAVWRAISARDDASHKLWTDDYLSAFAQSAGATLATLDHRLGDRYPSVRVVTLT
jgi:toxin-antitoxin system PIN domain toxin